MLPPTVTIPSRGAPGPVLVVVPSIFGVTADLVEQLQQLSGFATSIALDPFHRVLPGPIAYDARQAGLQRMGDTDPEDVARDLYAVIDRARSLPECNGHVVTLGVSFGGRFAVEAAADGIVDAAVTWHGAGLVPLAERLGGGAAPLSLHFGEEDPTNPLSDVERLRLALASHPSAEVRVYPGARPGFALPHHAAWDATAAAGAMSGLRRSLQLLLGPRRPRRLIWI